MAKKAKKERKASPVRWGMQVHRAASFRHRADRRPKDARRSREYAAE